MLDDESSSQSLDSIVCIAPGCWVGTAAAAANIKLLHELGIGEVLRVMDYKAPKPLRRAYKQSNIHYEFFRLHDHGSDVKRAEKVWRMTHAHLKRPRKTSTLLHCAEGASRSISCMVYHLMIARHMPPERVLHDMIRPKRKCAAPNHAFTARLSALYTQISG